MRDAISMSKRHYSGKRVSREEFSASASVPGRYKYGVISVSLCVPTPSTDDMLLCALTCWVDVIQKPVTTFVSPMWVLKGSCQTRKRSVLRIPVQQK